MDSRQVALIRGINMARAKWIAMADLRRMMERLGYRDCRTLLNSGNVIFTAGEETPATSCPPPTEPSHQLGFHLFHV